MFSILLLIPLYSIECHQDTSVFLRKIIHFKRFFNVLLKSIANILFLLLLDFVFDLIKNKLEILPFYIPKILFLFLGLSKLLDILRLLYDLHRFDIHLLVFLLFSQNWKVIYQYLILHKRENSFEKYVSHNIRSIIIVTLQPFLHEIKIFILFQNNLICTFSKCFFDNSVNFQNWAFFND